MFIESLIKRPGGSKIHLDNKLYHFVEFPNGHHVCDVPSETHATQLLAIKEGFAPYTAKSVPKIEKPVVWEEPKTEATWPQEFTDFLDQNTKQIKKGLANLPSEDLAEIHGMEATNQKRKTVLALIQKEREAR